MKICIAIVSNRLIQPKTVLSLANLLRETKYETHVVISTEGYTTAQGRIYCVIQALKNNCTHILFLDDDMTFFPSTLNRLLSHEKEIVGVNSYSRIFPLSPTLMLCDEKGEYKNPDHHPSWEMKIPESLFECYAIGMGVALIDLKVFKKIKKPWFKFDMHKDGYMLKGEDAWFCVQAKKAGFKIYCDPNIPIGHLGITEYGEELDNKLKEIYQK